MTAAHRENPKRGLAYNLLMIFVAVFVVLVLGVVVRFGWMHYYRAAFPIGYMEYVLRYSEQNNVPAELVFAVIRSESGFDYTAVSEAYARGLMQITEETFEWARWRMGDYEDRSFDELFIPEINIRYGTFILHLKLERFGGEREALAAYHAGWGSVTRWLEDERFSDDGLTLRDTPFRRTNAYVYNVLFARDVYRSLYDFEGGQLNLSNFRLLHLAWQDIITLPRGWFQNE